MEFRQTPVPPWRPVCGSFWSLGSLHSSISVGLACLWGLSVVMQMWGTSDSLEDSWLKPRSQSCPKPVRYRWGRKEVFVQPTGSRMVFCYPFVNLGEMPTELTGSWSLGTLTYRIGAFHIIEAGREEALSPPPSLHTNTPILLHLSSSWLSQPERWASVPVMGCVTAAKYRGLSAASFCKMVVLNTVSLDDKCQEHNISC